MKSSRALCWPLCACSSTYSLGSHKHTLSSQLIFERQWTGTMAQGAEAPAGKPDDLSLLLRSHVVDGATPSGYSLICTAPSVPWHALHTHACTRTPLQTHMQTHLHTHLGTCLHWQAHPSGLARGFSGWEDTLCLQRAYIWFLPPPWRPTAVCTSRSA